MKVQAPCTTCTTSTRPGLLWLGGKDWVECPECTEGVTTFDESLFTPKARTVFIPGCRPHVELKMPDYLKDLL